MSSTIYFFSCYLIYFSYYLCRYNLPIAVPIFKRLYGWNEASLGVFFTALSLVYAFGQFINGHAIHNVNSLRWFIVLGASGSVLVNIAIYICLEYVEQQFALFFIVATLWGLNGYFQSTGWPSVVSAMHSILDPDTRGKTMGFFATSFQLGGATASALAVALTYPYSTTWKYVFLVPACVFAGSILIFGILYRDSPRCGDEDIDDNRGMGHVIRNPPVILSAVAYLLLTMCRYTFVNWLPDYMTSTAVADQSMIQLAIKVAIHPVAGSIGTIITGWVSDVLLGGRRVPLIIALLFVNAGLCAVFPFISPSNLAVQIVVIAGVGFFTYGAVGMISGHLAQDFSPEYPGAAAGFIDGFGYVGAAVAGVGVGAIATNGYNWVFIGSGIASCISGVALLPLFFKRPRAAIKTEIVAVTPPMND